MQIQLVKVKYKNFLVKKMLRNLVDAAKVENSRFLHFPRIFPTSVLLATTYMCNSRCKMCNIWKIYRNKNKKIEDELDLNEFTTFIKKNKFLNKIALTGGELFLRDDLYDMIIFLDEIGYNTDILTNGILSNKIKKEETRILDGLSGEIPHVLSISIDGLGRTHDYLRGRKGLFDRSVKLLKWFMIQKDKYDFFDVSVSHTITEKNYMELNSFVDYFVNLGLKPQQISFRIAQNSFYFNNMKKEKTSINIRYIIQEIQKLQEKYDFFKNDFFYKKISQFLLYPNKLVIPCAAASSFCYIDPYWNVYPCIQWGKKLGNLREFNFDLKSLWEERIIKETQQMVKREKCPKCWTQCSAIPSMNTNLPILTNRYLNSIKYIKNL